ncbi:MAG TPA: hypothetical protein VFZ21_32845 [Gemmatimonadaceae bacterium]|nr:hypothetical protein [Gemmatimonadaceae bacterium]
MQVVGRRWLVAVVLAVSAAPIGAQMIDSASGARATGGVRAQAIGLVTRVDPAVAGRTYTEGYLAQPVIMAHGSVFRGALSGVVTLDFEGLTLERGQLTPGAYGEGYADRRHPHTYLHEALVIAQGAFRQTRVSLTAGKGFVPFGTDDPMMRPFAMYPANHHLAQILERYVAIGAVQYGPIALEAAVFNGDEPLSAGAPPDASRFGDSWSMRATYTPIRPVELQGSYAFVTSPELAGGAGLDQRKWSAAIRFDRPTGRVRGGLLEWARTDALLGDLRTNSFTSVLGEAAMAAGPVTFAGRYETTTRPEEQRLLDPFRVSRTPTDLGIIGITRWQIGTLAASVTRSLGPLDVAPFAEVSFSRPTEELTPTAFVPREFYGSTSIWSVSLGARFGVGPALHRMGRYGAGLPNASSSPHAH